MFQTDEEFADLVNRALKRKATPEEIEYLQSSPLVIARWRTELCLLRHNVNNQIADIKAQIDIEHQKYLMSGMDDDDDAWLQYRAEQVRRMNRAKSFRVVVEAKLTELKAYEKQVNVLKSEDDKSGKAFKSGYCDGWLEAIDYLLMLQKKGLPTKEAYMVCRIYWQDSLISWKKREGIEGKPPLSHNLGELKLNNARAMMGENEQSATT